MVIRFPGVNAWAREKSMRILVTGGAGYIGSVVTEELINAGHQAVVYDNLSYGHREAVHPSAAFVKGDLLDGEALRGVLRENEIEAVMHMAAFALVGESVTHPAKYYQNNLVGGLSLLNAMRECGVKRLVFSSTCATYGEPAKVPIDESLPNNPTNPYGESKLAFERALKWFDSAYGLRYASLRYFNAAGATERCGEMHDPETHLIPLVLQTAAGAREEQDESDRGRARVGRMSRRERASADMNELVRRPGPVDENLEDADCERRQSLDDREREHAAPSTTLVAAAMVTPYAK